MWLPCAIAVAQEPPSDGPPAWDDLDDVDDVVVVTATRSEAPVRQAPVAVEVITRAEIEATGAETLGELLEEQPGLQIDDTVTGVAIRMQGMDPEHTLILVDGQRVLGNKDGVVDLSRFALENIERVEVVKGPSSALYGADAMGGVVHIVTRKPPPATEVGLHLRAGTLGKVDGSADVSTGSKDLRGRISVGWHQADAWDLDPSDPATNSSAYRQGDVDVRLSADPSADAHLDLTASYMQRRMDGVSSTAFGAVIDDEAIIEDSRAAVSGWWLPAAKTKISARLSGSVYRAQVIADQRGGTSLDTIADDRENLGEASVQVDQGAGDHFVTVGLDGLVQDLSTERLATGKGSRQRIALFAQDAWGVTEGDWKLSIVPGARIDVDSQFGRAITPRLATALIGEKASFRLGAGSAFRAPSFRELYLRFENPGVGYVVEGSEELRPERSVNVNGNVELAPRKGVWLTLSGYHNHIRDLILVGTADSEPGALQVYEYVNIARARTTGWDAQVRLRPDPLELELGYAFVDAVDLDLERELEGRVPHRITGVVGVELPADVHVRAQGGWSSPRPFYVLDDAGEEIRVDQAARFTTDLRAVWKAEPLEVFAGVDNLFDSGGNGFLPLVPRFVYAGLNFRARRP